ncbi:MAG TPA: murein L,D-transpeptidase catalytic domain family protein [Gemmatimonadaceae bacterium]
MRPIKHMRNVLIGTTASLIVGAAAPATILAAPIRPAGSHTVSTKVSSPDAETKAAVNAFSTSVRGLSHPRALESAFHAYYAYKAAHPDEVKKPYLYFVDFGQPATAARGYVFDMNSRTIVDGPFTVAHGSGSGSGIPTRFSNGAGTKATSLGLYTTASTYAFSGKNAGRPYKSVGLRLKGQSKGFNDAALARGVVAHGAPYVTATKAGRSQGCPAMEPSRADRLLPMIANGSVVFLFAPDAGWMASDQWIAA